MLRKPPKDMSENELEGVFVKAMGLFRLFNEKDEFEQYYRKHLRKRLLQKRSASDDNERTFIGKLRDHCGFAFTSKMETMFNDMFTSADLTRSFRDVQNNVPGLKDVDLDVTVLTMGVWPMMKTYSNPIVLPKQCQDAVKAFEWHYGQLHSGRKLNWQLNMGRADIKAAFPSGKYELSVSTLQMCVLMCFQGEQSQGGPRLSLQTIGDMTGLSGDELKVSLEALTCVSGKDILVKSPPGNEMSPTDVFELNKAFKSKTARVKILSSSSKRETDQERSVTRGKLTDDRKPQIEAAIVRIMKAKKRLDYNSIVLEVTSQVRNRFLPTPGDIKKHLEGLIDRDFIERDPDDRKVYLYRR
jgi:cullin 3